MARRVHGDRGRGGRRRVAAMLIGLLIGAPLGALVAAALALLALGNGGGPPALAAAALVGVHLGGVLGMLYGLLDTALTPRHRGAAGGTDRANIRSENRRLSTGREA